MCICMKGHTVSSAKGTKEEGTCANRGLCDLTDGSAGIIMHVHICI